MKERWVNELTGMAQAVLRTAIHQHGDRHTCLHCLNSTTEGLEELFHEADCPVTSAERVLRQADRTERDRTVA